MSTPQDHYEKVLAQHYTWMFAMPFAEKVAEQKAILREAGIMRPRVAVDLGCGSGFQSVALAEFGARCVHAIDTSESLLGELADHAQDRPITTHLADLCAFKRIVTDQPDTVVCMGDTLTHLPSKTDVAELIADIASVLPESGRLVLSWRDLTSPPSGLDRFIPLRSDDERIMTCFLEDQGDAVLVHDLVYVRQEDGWTLQKSAYPKLKLTPDWVKSVLAEVGLDVGFEKTVRGMTILSAVH